MPRILCLHGVGSSGAILEAQMANIQRELDPSFELVFIDAPFECERGPGVPDYHPGPFYAHTESYAPVDMATAVDCLEDVLEYEGPFDGIFGFSQGAALTLSYFYRQQAIGEPVAVKFACLFSTAMPCSPDDTLGDSVIDKLQSLQYDITDRANPNIHELLSTEQEYVDVLQRTIVAAGDDNCLMPWIEMDVYRNGERENVPRVMHPSLLEWKVTVPTVHCWGTNDFPYLTKMSEVAHSICDESRTKQLTHSGSHDVPKKRPEIKAVIRQLEWAMNWA